MLKNIYKEAYASIIEEEKSFGVKPGDGEIDIIYSENYFDELNEVGIISAYSNGLIELTIFNKKYTNLLIDDFEKITGFRINDTYFLSNSKNGSFISNQKNKIWFKNIKNFISDNNIELTYSSEEKIEKEMINIDYEIEHHKYLEKKELIKQKEFEDNPYYRYL